MIRLPPGGPDFKAAEIDDFGYGIITREGPTKLPFGAALESYDCDYEARNISNRAGYDTVLENGPGAIKLASFETTEVWSGGSADTVNFVAIEAEAAGTRGRAMSAVGGAGEVSMTLLGLALNTGVDPLEVFNCWIMPTALPAGITGYTLTLRFQTSPGNYYQATIAADTDTPNVLELGLWKYHRFRRQDFAKTGTPDWTAITQIRFGLTATGSGTLILTVDNLHRTPGLIQDLFQFRRESGAYQGGTNQYAIARGNLYRQGTTRWETIITGFDPSVQVYSRSIQDRRVITDGVTSPRVLMSDGVTVYRLGIVTPPRQVVTTQIGGGGLPDGDYFVQVLYYSSVTGTFSAPDDRSPTVPLTITGGAGTAGIRFTNLPVSSDPQVDWLVVAIRPSIEPELFFRITDGIFGDVPNGTTTVDYVGTLSALQARTETVVDPDLDYPSVIDPATQLPVEAHPLYLAEAGNYLVTVMAEQPTVVRWSRFRSPGSWRIDDEQPLGENDNEALTGLETIAGALLAFKRNGVFFARVAGGDSGITFEQRISDRGSVNHKGILTVGHVLFYPGEEGIYKVEGDFQPRLITAQAQPTWDGLWDPNRRDLGCSLLVRARNQVVHYARTLGAFRNNQGWVTHYRSALAEDRRQGKWPTWAPTLWRMPAEQATEVRTSGGYEPWIAGNGQVFRANYGVQDDRRPIESIHRTSLYSPDSHYTHLFNWLDTEMNVAGNVQTEVQVYCGTDITPAAILTANMTGQSVPLGSFVLGASPLGTGKYVAARFKLPRRVVRYVSFRFRFRGRAHWELYEMDPWSKAVSRWRTAM